MRVKDFFYCYDKYFWKRLSFGVIWMILLWMYYKKVKIIKQALIFTNSY